MRLEGSCHCRKVRFRVDAPSPVPFLRCYCSICRKVAGGGGYAINLGADARTLEIEGEAHIKVYETRPEHSTKSARCGRRLCSDCGTALCHLDPRRPDLGHPFASAHTTDLPAAPAHTPIIVETKGRWTPVNAGKDDALFDGYPGETLAEWHARHGYDAR